jgi:cytochrome b6-f complex iron-sulfur subunit
VACVVTSTTYLVGADPGRLTSFSPTGQVLSHLLRIAPDPLPRLDVRERDGSIEVFVADKPPTEPA